MYLFYIDECGRPSLEDKALSVDPWFVMSAVGVRDDQWFAIDEDFSHLKQKFFPQIKKKFQIELKSSNIRSAGGPYPKKPFGDIPLEKVTEMAEEIYAIYHRYQLPIFSVVINRQEHKDKYESAGKRPEGPYQLAFKMLIERIDWYLENQNEAKNRKDQEIGFVMLDEYVGQYKVTRSNLLWYQEAGTFAKKSIDHIKEVPFFLVSHYSQLLTLPDFVVYNVYHRFRYNKPEYSFYKRQLPNYYNKNGKLWGYGLKVFPNRKARQKDTDEAMILKEGGGISATYVRNSRSGTRLKL